MNLRNRSEILFPLGLVVLSLCAFANGLGAPFLFDDMFVIVQNPSIDSLSPLPVTGRFLVDFTFRLNYALAGLNPIAFRIVNIIIHAANALLLYGIVRRTLGRVWRGSLCSVSADSVAFISAALWLVHPVQVQAVTYISQRYELGMAFFLLAGVYAHARSLEGRNERMWLDAGLACCIAGMGCKEVMVVAPVVFILYDWCFAREHFVDVIRIRAKAYVALVLTWGVFAAIWVSSVYQAVLREGVVAQRFDRWEYFLTQMKVLPYYFRIGVLPQGLSFDHDWEMAGNVLSVLPQLVLVLFCVVVVVSGLLLRRGWAYPWAWWGVILAPTSSFFQLADPVVEHRLYLPLAAVTTVAAVMLVRAKRVVDGWGSRGGVGAGWPVLFRVVPAVLIMVLLSQTIVRNRIFSDELLLWGDVLQKEPWNLRAQVAVGKALLDRGEIQAAESRFNGVLGAMPVDRIGADRHLATQYALAHNNLGVIEWRRGDVEAACGHFVAAVTAAPGYDNARRNMRICRRKLIRR